MDVVVEEDAGRLDHRIAFHYACLHPFLILESHVVPYGVSECQEAAGAEVKAFTRQVSVMSTSHRRPRPDPCLDHTTFILTTSSFLPSESTSSSTHHGIYEDIHR